AMFGAVLAAVVATRQPEVGGLANLLSNPAIADKLSIFPDMTNPSVWIPLLLIPVAVQWWSVWYPGAEPGGGGYIAQRMLSAKNEKNAIGATLLFNFAHYALRPWPWIIVALASLVVFPDLPSIKEAFPAIADNYLKDDIAYPAMLSKIGPGWLGLVTASLIAAYMSTIGTHLNWGSSYIVNDFYKRFVKPDAPEKELVTVGRFTTILLMVIASLLSLFFLNNATQAFNVLLLSGAGTGAIYLLRWFWWRINAWTEIVAMIVATIVAVVLVFFVPDESITFRVLDAFTVRLLIAVGVTTVTWLTTTLLTKPEPDETLIRFYKVTRPGGPGWRSFRERAAAAGVILEPEGRKWDMPLQLLCVFVGTIVIYSALFSIGSFVYLKPLNGIILAVVAVAGTWFLFRSFNKISEN
ncbi:MAG: Na+:solute symporter, partial [Bacteroidales bacterium]|nr:Na+:solute symporter [Bacteroidales bacterium]